jgi:hypothetical protein
MKQINTARRPVKRGAVTAMPFMAFSPEPVSQMNPIGREYSRFSGCFTRQGVRPDDRIRFENRIS